MKKYLTKASDFLGRQWFRAKIVSIMVPASAVILFVDLMWAAWFAVREAALEFKYEFGLRAADTGSLFNTARRAFVLGRKLTHGDR